MAPLPRLIRLHRASNRDWTMKISFWPFWKVALPGGLMPYCLMLGIFGLVSWDWLTAEVSGAHGLSWGAILSRCSQAICVNERGVLIDTLKVFHLSFHQDFFFPAIFFSWDHSWWQIITRAVWSRYPCCHSTSFLLFIFFITEVPPLRRFRVSDLKSLKSCFSWNVESSFAHVERSWLSSMLCPDGLFCFLRGRGERKTLKSLYNVLAGTRWSTEHNRGNIFTANGS